MYKQIIKIILFPMEGYKNISIFIDIKNISTDIQFYKDNIKQ